MLSIFIGKQNRCPWLLCCRCPSILGNTFQLQLQAGMEHMNSYVRGSPAQTASQLAMSTQFTFKGLYDSMREIHTQQTGYLIFLNTFKHHRIVIYSILNSVVHFCKVNTCIQRGTQSMCYYCKFLKDFSFYYVTCTTYSSIQHFL